MHGKNSLKKTIRQARRPKIISESKRSKSYLEVGSWRFEENDLGDLIVKNMETEQTVIIIRKEG